MQIFLVRRVEAKPVGHADGFFVEPFQLGIGHVFDLGRLMEQLAIEQLPAEPRGELPGDFAAAGTVLPRNGNDLHGSDSGQWA